MRLEENSYAYLNEVCEDYRSITGELTLSYSSTVKPWLEDAIAGLFADLLEVLPLGRFRNYLMDAIFTFISHLSYAMDSILNGRFYFDSNYLVKDDFGEIHSDVINLSRELLSQGFIKDINYGLFFNDEPKTFRFSASYGDFLIKNSDSGGPPGGGGVSGSSFTSREEALMKCLGEGIERACGGFYKEKDLVKGSYDDLKNRGLNLVNPLSFVSFSEKQYKKNPSLAARRVKENSFLKWVLGNSLITGEEVLVPAQAVYVPYSYDKNEAFIRSNITTGAAVYTEKKEAIYRGLCEVVERDAFIIYYLNKIKLPEIDIEKSFDGKLKSIFKTLKRYNLEIHVLDSTTDIFIPTFLTLVIDRTGLGPALTSGNKSDFDVEKAVLGSMVEALKSRAWAVRILREKELIEEFEKAKDKIISLKHRAFYWTHIERIKDAEFYFGGPKKILNPEKCDLNSDQKLEKALEYFNSNKMELVMVDTSIPQVKKMGFFSVMIMAPELHHMHLWEEYKCFGGKRLYEVPVKMGYLKKPKEEEGMNLVPHLFP